MRQSWHPYHGWTAVATPSNNTSPKMSSNWHQYFSLNTAYPTVNDLLCPTFRSACQQRGLLESDHQWHETIQDAILTTPPAQICRLFAMVLSICHPADPGHLWDSYKDSVADDYLHQYCCQITLPYHDQIYNRALVDIENHTYHMACQTLDTYGPPSPDRSVQQQLQTEIIHETTYNKELLEKLEKDNEEKLLPVQCLAYCNILCWVHDRLGGPSLMLLEEQAKHFFWTWSLPKCVGPRGLQQQWPPQGLSQHCLREEDQQIPPLNCFLISPSMSHQLATSAKPVVLVSCSRRVTSSYRMSAPCHTNMSLRLLTTHYRTFSEANNSLEMLSWLLQETSDRHSLLSGKEQEQTKSQPP